MRTVNKYVKAVSMNIHDLVNQTCIHNYNIILCEAEMEIEKSKI